MTIWEFRALVRQEWQRFQRGYCPLGCAYGLEPQPPPIRANGFLQLPVGYAYGVVAGFDGVSTVSDSWICGHRYGRRMRFIASKKGYLSP